MDSTGNASPLAAAAAPMVPPESSVEAGEDSGSEEDSDTDSSEDGRLGKLGPTTRLWWRHRRGKLTCSIIGALIVALFTFLIWPHMPTWEVRQVNFDSAMISLLAGAFYTDGYNETVIFPLNATVDVWNPNFIAGAWVGEGHFNVTYGSLVIGRAKSLPMYSPHRAACVSHAEAENLLTPEVSAFMRSQLTPDFKLKGRPHVHGSVPVKVWGFIPLTVRLTCSVAVHLLDLVTVPPGKVVYDHDCEYGLR